MCLLKLYHVCQLQEIVVRPDVEFAIILYVCKNILLDEIYVGASISSLDLSNNKKLSSSNINFKFNNNGIKVDSHPCLFKLSELNSSIDDERVVRVVGVDSVEVGETLYFKAIGDTISYTYDVNNEEIDPLSFYISATDADHLHFYKDGVCERCGEERIVTSLADNAQLSLSVYPNPAVDYISVTGEVSSYKVIILLGETVVEGTDARRVNVSSLTSGNYLIRLVAKDGFVKLISFLKK